MVEVNILSNDNWKSFCNKNWIAFLPEGITFKELREAYIMDALERHSWNRTHAAAETEIPLRTFTNWLTSMRKEGINIPKVGKGYNGCNCRRFKSD